MAAPKNSQEKLFFCSICPYRSRWRSGVSSHMKRIHSDEKPSQCTLCDFSTKSNSDLTWHMRRRHEDPDEKEKQKKFLCQTPDCKFRCLSRSELEAHLKTHGSKKDVKCPHCPYATKTQGNLSQHLRSIHTEAKPFKCTLCPYSAKKMYSVKQHTGRIHGGEASKKHACPHCTFRTFEASKLKIHLRSHTGEKPFSCTLCQHRAGRRGHLNEHIARMHTKEKTFRCEVCKNDQATFVTKSELRIHMRSHEGGDKPFKCQQDGCQYEAAQRPHLYAHQRTHTGEKPFACSLCHFKGTTATALKTHVICSHTTDKPFGCTLCKFKCKLRQSLLSHMRRRHTGETP